MPNARPRILFFDIETRPMVAEVWGMRDQNLGLNQVREWGGTLCVAAKWSDRPEVMFFSDWKDGHRGMLEAIHALWSEADAICGYNNDKFDNKKLRGEFLREGMDPPPPPTSIDLYKTVRSEFGFDSNKLDHVAQLLGLGSKIKHEGHGLWTKVLAGDEAAQNRMERYCRQDAKLTEKVYRRIRPFIKTHPYLHEPNRGQCGTCGSTRLEARGFHTTKSSERQRYKCQSCRSWQLGPVRRVA